MVSRITKRTPTKTIKDCRISHHNRHRRRKSPIKNAAAAASRVVTSINKSICTCHRRLIKIFSKLARIGTPKRTSRKEGYQVLKKNPALDHQDIRRALFAAKHLPPVFPPERKTVFLDLDETLIHSIPEIPPEKYDFVVRPVIDNQKVDFYVLKRPFVDEFLEILSEKFEIVVFTAGIEEYASLVLDRLDRRNVISHRLYRDSCKPGNAIPILPFTEDLEDGELRKVIEFFEQSDRYEDMRDAVKQYTAEEGDKTVEFKL